MENDVTTIYTKEDFLDGTAPFEEVYKYRKDGFEFSRAIERMADVAKVVKVANFKKLFQEYCKKIMETDSESMSANVSNFDEQALELDTGLWVADDYEIYTFDRGGAKVTACTHPIMPVQRLINIDTGVGKMKLAYKRSGQWKTAIFERKQLANARSIVDVLSDYEISVTSETAKYLVKYLQDVEDLNFDRIPKTNSVSRLGWIGEEGFSPYVENLVFDGDVFFKHFFESVTTRGSENKWIETVKDIRSQGNIPTKIVLAASFASVLVEPCNCMPFFVHLWGGTETGKTVGLMLAASVWANPEMGKYIHTFNSTAVAQELSAGFVNSLPLVLDELQIIKDRKDFDQTIYQLSEGVGRSRGQKTGGLQRTNTWNNCIITNGEQPISSSNSGGGAVNRIIEISCEDVKLFDDPVGVVDGIRKHYGHAGRQFIELLSDPEVTEVARQTQKGIYKQLTESKITQKQALAASLILTADALIDQHIFKDGNGLTVKEVEQFLSTNEDVSVNRKAYNWLLEWIAQNKNRFKSDPQTDCWGETTIDRAYIIRNIFDSACKENGYNGQSLLSWLRRYDLIETGKKGFTKTKRVNGIPCNCVVLNLNLDDDMEKIPDGLEYDEEQTKF